MKEAGHLDPRAQEFRPVTHFTPMPPQIYYSYPSSSYPSPQQPMPSIYDGGVCYQPPPPPPAYVRQPPPPPSSPLQKATRALLLSSVPTHVTESTVRRELEWFGEVRGVEMERVREGIVTVHFYDLRHAMKAFEEIREQHMQQQSRLGQHLSSLMLNWRSEGDDVALPVQPPVWGLIAGRPVWAQFAVPTGFSGRNQGTLVVFNLDSEVSSSKLKEIFEAFGGVKELRETPSKRQHKFVEFFDIRDAARALTEMNGKEIYGKRILIEFSRPGGQGKRVSSSNSTHPPHRLSNQAVMSNPNCRNGSGFQGDYDSSTVRNTTNQSKQQQSESRRSSSSSSKTRHRRNPDTHFHFNEDTIDESSSCRDSRTTVMIKNIPNKYSQKLLLNMLDNHCIHCNEQIVEGGEETLSSYDFVYLPIDFNNKCNVGYGFVNLTTPEATWRLYKAFHLQPWEVFNSRKICEVTYARLQGLDALKEHFKNSKFACETDEYLPVLFSPPRDGKNLSEPLPIGGHATNNNATKRLVCGKTDTRADTPGSFQTTSPLRLIDSRQNCDYCDDGDRPSQ